MQIQFGYYICPTLSLNQMIILFEMPWNGSLVGNLLDSSQPPTDQTKLGEAISRAVLLNNYNYNLVDAFC